MLSYENDLRIGISTARGEVDIKRLTTDPGAWTELDTKITRLAHRVLNKSVKTAFFYAYHCSPTWEEIQLRFATELHRELKLETVRAYGERASAALIAAAPKATELE
jgi:hypothetical protein